jgi:hypothetical protein
MTDDSICRIREVLQEGQVPGPRTSAGFLVRSMHGAEDAWKVLVFGGLKSGWLFTNDTFVGSMAQGDLRVVWRKLRTSVKPGTRWGHQLVAVGERNFLFGGANGETVYDDLWEFDELRGWSSIQLDGGGEDERPCARSGHGSCSIVVKGIPGLCLFVSGGNTQSETFSDCWVWSVALGQWFEVFCYPELRPRIGHCVLGVSAGKVLLFGGRQLHPEINYIETVEVVERLRLEGDGRVVGEVRDLATVEGGRTGTGMVQVKGGVAFVGGHGQDGELDELVVVSPNLGIH